MILTRTNKSTMVARPKIFTIFFLALAVLNLSCAGKGPAPKPGIQGEIVESDPRPDPEALKHFMDGQMYMNQDNFSMAIIEFQEALSLDPSAGAIHISLAECYWNLGKVNRSEEHLLKAVKLDASDREAHEMLANQYVIRQEQELAEAEFKKLIDLDPKRSEYRMALAELYQLMNRMDDAISVYRQAYRIDPNQIGALEQAAQISLRSKNLKKAEEIFELLIFIDGSNIRYLQTYVDLVVLNENIEMGIQVLERILDKLGPSPERLSHLAFFHYQNEKPEKAKEYLQWVKDEYVPSARVMNLLITIYLESSEFDSARKYADEMIQLFQDDPRGFVHRAMVALNREKPNIAIDVLLPVADQFNKDFTVQYILGTAFNQLKLLKQAEQYLQRALIIYPESRNTRHGLALIYDSQGRWVESDSLYLELIASDSLDAQALNNYAYSLAEREIELEKALDLSSRAVSLEPENSAYLDTFGWIYFKLGNLNQALKYIQKSVDLEDTNAIVLEHLGDVLTSVQKVTQAVEVYRKALELDRENERLKAKAFPE